MKSTAPAPTGAFVRELERADGRRRVLFTWRGQLYVASFKRDESFMKGRAPRLDLTVGACDEDGELLDAPPPSPELNAELQSLGRSYAAWSGR